MTTLLVCDVGDVVVVRGTLEEEDGTPVTGATVTARVLPPDEVEQTPTVGEDGNGVYSATFEPNAPGPWFVRMTSDAPEKAASPDGVVQVRETRFA